MNKLFIVCVLIAVALANKTTQEDCDKLAKKCKKCVFAKKDTKKCKNEKADINCVVTKKCHQDVIDEAAKKAKADAKKLEEKYSKFCPTDKAKCRDTTASCRAWAAQSPSQCTANPDWMLPNCAMSCCPLCTGKNTLKTGTCPSKDRKDLCVKNTSPSCHAWATKKNSECTKNPKWMRSNCMQSCCATCKTDANKCPTVKETCANNYAKPNKKKGNAKCVEWAKNGQCTANMKWMSSNCSKECCPVCAAKAPVQAQQRVVYQQQPQRVVYQQPQQRVMYQQPVQAARVVQQPVQAARVVQQPVVQQPVFGGYATSNVNFRG